MGIRIGFEAIGQVRLALADMKTRHDRLIKSAAKVPGSVYSGLAFKSGTGRDRALQKLSQMMPAPFQTYEHNMVWRSLRPRSSPLTDLAQDGVEVVALVAGRSRGEAVMTDAGWGLFLTYHALGRYWERTDQRPVSFRTTVEEAHSNLLSAPYDTFRTAHSGRKDWMLPAGDGAFACDVRVVRNSLGDSVVVFRARTWLSSDMLLPHQRAMCAAIMFQGENLHPLGTGVLLPPQRRALSVINDGWCQLPLEIRPARKPGVLSKKFLIKA